MSDISGVSQVRGGNHINAVYEDESSKDVSVDSFLQLMIAQLQNQDFTNPMDDTQYVTQLAQFATMQQMQELAYYSKSNYVMSMVGKDVTVAKMSIGGSVDKITGPVEKISVVNNEFMVFVKGKAYQLNEIMEILPTSVKESSGSTDKVVDLGLSLVNSTADSATIEWEIPTEEQNPDAARLRYSVYYSTSERFDTVADIERGTLVGDADRTGIIHETIDGLAPNTTYYINVLVKDVDGKVSAYKKLSFVTPAAERV